MSEASIKAIDDAVRAHFAEVLTEIAAEVKPLTSAWLVVAEIQTLEGGELLWDNTYATSETSSPNTSLGLAVWAGDELRDIRATSEEEES